MSEIPEDIMRIADGIASDIPTRVTDMHRTFAANVIARAILAERERAAKVAESHQWAGDPSDGLDIRNSVWLEIAAEIRRGSQ